MYGKTTLQNIKNFVENRSVLHTNDVQIDVVRRGPLTAANFAVVPAAIAVLYVVNVQEFTVYPGIVRKRHALSVPPDFWLDVGVFRPTPQSHVRVQGRFLFVVLGDYSGSGCAGCCKKNNVRI